MKLELGLTVDANSYSILSSCLDRMGYSYEIENKNNLDLVVVGIISISESGKPLNGIEPSVSFKNKRWGVGLYLDNNYVCSNPPMPDLNKYIRHSICKRMEELKTYKTLRGIKDRTMLDDIIEKFL